MDQLLGTGLVFAAVGAVSYALVSAVEQPVPAEVQLTQITGRLIKPITMVSHYKAETYATLEVQTVDGRIAAGQTPYTCFLWRDCVLPQELVSLRVGDAITMWLAPPVRFHGDSRYIWRIDRNDRPLLPFHETVAANAAQRARYLHMFGGFGLVGVLMAFSAIVSKYVRSRRHP